MSALQVRRLDHVAQAAPETATVLEYYRGLGAELSAGPDGGPDRHSLLRVGPLPIQLKTGGPGGWRSIGWTVAATNDAAISGFGLEIGLRPGSAGDQSTVPPRPTENPLALTATPTISVRSRSPDKAARWLADVVGGQPYREERKHLNTLAVGVRLADHAVEFVASLTGSEHDLIGAALVEHGEGIHQVRLATTDFFLSRARLAQADVRFTQMGSRSLLLEAEHAGGAIIDIHAI